MGTYSYKSAIICGDEAPVAVVRDAVEKVCYAARRMNEAGPIVTNVEVGSNGTASFAILPEGSKLGWPRHQWTEDAIETAEHNARRLRGVTVAVTWFGETGYGYEVHGQFSESSHIKGEW